LIKKAIKAATADAEIPLIQISESSVAASSGDAGAVKGETVIEIEVLPTVGSTGRVVVGTDADVVELTRSGMEVVVLLLLLLVPLDRLDSTSAARAEVTNEYKASPGQEVIDMSR
jgi:hypothetical protein